MRTRLVSLVLLSIMLVAAGCRSLPGATPLPGPSATEAGSGSTPLPVSQPTATSQPTASPAPGITPTLQPTNSGTSSKPADADVDAAVQAILDYWGAVNQRDYARAYGYWAENGRASGQSLEQFTNGFANTVQVTVQIGSLEQGSAGQRTVTLPVTLAAVSNAPNNTTGGQLVQHFRGTYTLQPRNPSAPAGGEWWIASAAIAEVSGSAEPPSDVQDPAMLVRSYFDAINRRDFGRAFTYWAHLGQTSGQTFAQFHQGFATTRQVAIQLGTAREEGAAGSIYARMPIIIVATQTDGTTKTYCGTYTLRRLNVPPFDQFGWRIESASIVARASVQLGSAEAEKLLAGGCGASAK